VKVLVTGGAGFIGSHVVDKLRVAGHEPRILDLVPSAYHADVDTVLGDLCEPAVVERALDGVDAVLHLAALADVDLVAKDPTLTDHINTRGTQLLLEGTRRSGVRRFVYASTIWVYGDASGPEALDEETTLGLPKHFYTAT
jgi:UDP-glucose 4-epimerase